MLLKLHERDSPNGYSFISDTGQNTRPRSLSAHSIGTDIYELSSCDSDSELSHIASAYDDKIAITFSPLTTKPPLHPPPTIYHSLNESSHVRVLVNTSYVTENSQARLPRRKVINQPLRRPVSSLIHYDVFEFETQLSKANDCLAIQILQIPRDVF